jgi:hypothetical protein
LTARLLDFAPAAWQEYQRLRADDIGGRLKQVLEQLADDPALVRADPDSCRCPIIERQLRQAAEVWGLFLGAPGGDRWLVVWREMASVTEIGYVGSAPGAADADVDAHDAR